MGQMKKYKVTMDYFTQENTSLKKEVDSRKSSIKKQLDAGTLRNENEKLQRFIDNIPQDMMREIQSQQRQPPQKGRYERD